MKKNQHPTPATASQFNCGYAAYEHKPDSASSGILGKMAEDYANATPAATPSGGDPCVICEQPITEYDSYGVSAKSNHRYHWHCVRKEAATVSPSGGGEWTVSRELYTATLRDGNFTELLRLSLTQDVDLQRIADAHNAALRDRGKACYCCREGTCQPGCRCADMLETSEQTKEKDTCQHIMAGRICGLDQDAHLLPEATHSFVGKGERDDNLHG